jgi:thioredoxin-like negative regulator of GroEL
MKNLSKVMLVTALTFVTSNVMATREITQESELQTVIDGAGDKTVVLYVYGATCPHCKRFTPKFQNVESQLRDKNVFVKAESRSEVAAKHHVNSVPYVEIIRNGKKVTSKSGVRDENDLKNLVNTK